MGEGVTKCDHHYLNTYISYDLMSYANWLYHSVLCYLNNH